MPTAGPEGALARLHAALAQGDPTTAFEARRVPRAEFLARMQRLRQLQEADPQAVTEDGWQHLLADLDAQHTPARTMADLAGVRGRLGNGRCARVREHRVPEALGRVGEAVEGWPPAGMRLRADLAAMAPATVAGVFRCAAGGEVRAVVGPRSPTEPTLVVLALE